MYIRKLTKLLWHDIKPKLRLNPFRVGDFEAST